MALLLQFGVLFKSGWAGLPLAAANAHDLLPSVTQTTVQPWFNYHWTLLPQLEHLPGGLGWSSLALVEAGVEEAVVEEEISCFGLFSFLFSPRWSLFNEEFEDGSACFFMIFGN